MNDATADKQKARVERYLDRWLPCGFRWWKIDIIWDRGDHENCDDNRARHASATIFESWEYREATITFRLQKLAGLKDEEVEAVVVHELAHLLVGSIRDYSTSDKRQMTEFAVTSVTNALMWARDVAKDAKPKKKAPKKSTKPKRKR